MNNRLSKIRNRIENSIDVKKRILMDKSILKEINDISIEIITAFRKNKKVLFCGNGGSAADAQHIASELSGKFYLERPPLFAEALHVNSSYLTAVANDYSYEQTFSRLVQAKGKYGDILIGISTSGNSSNILRAIEMGKKLGMKTIGLTGETGGKLQNICDFIIKVPSDDVPRIQEAHILIGHIICELVENELFQND